MSLLTPTRFDSYPTVYDVSSTLLTMGIIVPSGFDITTPVEAAADEWESLTGWHPFLAQKMTKFLTPERAGPYTGRGMSSQGGRTLNLNFGVLQLPDDGLLIGYVANDTNEIGVTDQDTGSQGTVLIRDIQYFLRPDSAPSENYPYTYIEFPSVIRGIDKSIVLRNVTVGRMWTLTRNIYHVIEHYAIAQVLEELSVNVGGGIISSQTDDITQVFASSTAPFPFASQVLKWQDEFNRLAERYRRR